MEAADLAFSGLARQAQLIAAGEVSSRELTELYLERIDRLGPRVNAFTEVLAESALVEADAADAKRANGESAPLRGVPVAIKDNMDVEGAATCFGSLAFEDAPAAEDSVVVRRLRSAGAVILAKTTLSELAILPFTETQGWGATRNPWDPSRSCGGSSGGSGAAVAAGLAGAASATDGGGSIRIPAAFCGLYGLKPQRGRVPMEPPDHWYGLSASGCVTRTVADTALYLDAAAGPGGDRGGPPPPDQLFAEAAVSAAPRLRVAVSDRAPRSLIPGRVSDDARAGVAHIEEVLRGCGHDVRRHDPDYGLATQNLITRFLGGIHEDVEAVPRAEALEPRTRGIGRLGGAYPRAIVRRAWRAAAADADRIQRSLANYDVLLTPTVGETAIEVDRWQGQGALRTVMALARTFAFTPVWNHTGQPAAAVPAGFTDAGLPRSVSLIGRPGDEATLLSLSAQIEAETEWPAQRPPGF